MLNIDPQPHQKQFLECNGTAEKDPVRIVFFGGGAGGGKTWSILVDNLYGIHDPDYFSVFFRRTTTELETNLWPEAKKMYYNILFDKNDNPIGKAHINEQTKVITFPSGAKSKFSYLQHDKDADSYYGAELCKVYIDELQMHSEYAFTVLRSRNRSRAKVTKGMRFTLNPDPTHWMYEWIKPFLDEDGFPVQELGGKTRYFLILGGDLHTSWNKKELEDKFGKTPQTYTYVPARLEQNKVLQELDPEYFSVLDSLPEKKRNQLLLGCWKQDDASGYWRRDWLRKADKLPSNCKTVRSWDKANTEPSDSYPSPDFTTGWKISKDKNSEYYISADISPTNYDKKDPNIKGKFRRRAGDRDNVILDQCKWDGEEVIVVFPQDVGAAGQREFEESAKILINEGFVVKKDPMPPQKSKLMRFTPFAAACENGLVHILENTFPDKNTLEQFYTELETFSGERSTASRKDDIPDAVASGFNYLSKQKVLPPFSLNTGNSQNNLSNIKQSVFATNNQRG